MLTKLKNLFSSKKPTEGVVIPVDLLKMEQNIMPLCFKYGGDVMDHSDVIGKVYVHSKAGPLGAYRYKIEDTPRKVTISVRKLFPLFGAAPHPIITLDKEMAVLRVCHQTGYDLEGTLFLRVVMENHNRR